MPDIEDQPTAVYRMYDAAGRLLYVGMTNNTDVRWKWHAQSRGWWRHVSRKAVEWHPDRATARRHEALAIKSEAPLYNSMHAAAGPHDVPLRDARSQLSRIVDQVRILHEARWLTRNGHRTVAVVHPAFHDRAVTNDRIVAALREADPVLYAKLAASP